MTEIDGLEDAASEKDSRPLQTDLGQLAKLPLDVLLYYVLYGDEKLGRLKA